jgi:hypothetical protein
VGRIVAFSEFEEYLKKLSMPDFAHGCILDANILISLTYEIRDDHEEVIDFLDLLASRGFKCFTTVTTRAEFLDFHRKLIMTENLLDALLPDSKVNLSPRARAKIQSEKGQLARSPGSIFYDGNIKRIRAAFSEKQDPTFDTWKAICNIFLAGKIKAIDEELQKVKITYVSQHEESQKEFFVRKIDWPDARQISEETCLGISDSMILNALQCSHFPFVVSADSDFAFAALSSKNMKDIIMPEGAAARARKI